MECKSVPASSTHSMTWACSNPSETPRPRRGVRGTHRVADDQQARPGRPERARRRPHLATNRPHGRRRSCRRRGVASRSWRCACSSQTRRKYAVGVVSRWRRNANWTALGVTHAPRAMSGTDRSRSGCDSMKATARRTVDGCAPERRGDQASADRFRQVRHEAHTGGGRTTRARKRRRAAAAPG
jgi:hypothetical protein